MIEKFNFAESGIEKREKPVKVENVLAHLGVPTLLPVDITELDSESVLDKDLRALEHADCPSIIFGRPHVGEFVPTDLMDRMTPGGLMMSAMMDRGTQRLFRSERIPSIGFMMSRYVVDPNRSMTPPAEGTNKPVPGRILWTHNAIDAHGHIDEKLPIYEPGKEPQPEEVQDLIEQFYVPYYNAMMGVAGTLADRRSSTKQRVLVIDGHSYSNTATLDTYMQHYGVRSHDLPLFVIGDGDGASCDRDIRDAFVQALDRRFNALREEERMQIMNRVPSGRLVSVNEALKGVHNVKFWGEVAARERGETNGFNALQIEVNETPFTNDANKDWYQFRAYDDGVLALMQKLIEHAALDVDPLLKKSS